MSLYERINGDFERLLSGIQEEYPTTHQIIVETLQSKDYVLELTIEEANQIALHLDLGRAWTALDIYKLFEK